MSSLRKEALPVAVTATLALGALAALLVTATQDAAAEGAKRVRVRGRCNSCHKASFDQWKGSPHQTAWTNPVFARLSDDHGKKECLGCHAPESVVASGLEKEPAVRDKVPDSGVDCAGCHQDADGGIHGVHGLNSPDHEVVKDPKLGTVAMCASCHAKYGTVDEFKKTKYADQPEACASCHMPKEERPLVEDGKARPAHNHGFRAKDNPELLAKGLLLEAASEGGKIVAKLTSKDVGHMVPTGHDTKQLIIEVALGGAKQSAILSKSGDKDNRLAPGQTFTFEVPTEGKKGKATVRVLHKAAPDVADEEATVLLTAEVDV